MAKVRSASGVVTGSTEVSAATRGIFDCNEAHRSPLREDYERVFRSGMVALDTNVLLNLYRSNERTRKDTLAVLGMLRDRLWIPHQVLSEFWRNRESPSVRHHHRAKAKEATASLDKVKRSTEDALERWVAAVHLKNDERVTERIRGALEALGETMGDLRDLIEAQAESDALRGTAQTHTDPVLAELEPVLQGRVGEPLSPTEHDNAVREAQTRADDEIPPGYEDFKKKEPEQAAGDYVLWVQLLTEAKTRGCDVLLVTGDVKKDWWTPARDGDIPARPRPELVVELWAHAGVRLYMLTPSELLVWANQLLGLEVDEGSVSDLEQLREADGDADTVDGEWTLQSLASFMTNLMSRYETQAKVIFAAAANGGFVDRATVYELAGYPETRQLRGFTRPLNTITRELMDQGALTGEEPFLLRTIYGSGPEPSWASGFRIPDEVIPLLRDAYEGNMLWPDLKALRSETV
ncbi:PIN-like domain-containing protein [Streptomyces sp. Rer75]|uniref:PIN-like domain-containing protein n=1 Tax=Streptomyces sp. Rer75 TaxID=2750011 RepID=UPI0015D05F9C|nr:PIN-like domain-containing protein [Streptomyces sp. Rer75]QLH23586.1 DUF4935 domain-containing protein [Streptomyces sp. Rer75]